MDKRDNVCTSEIPGQACGEIFPRKTKAGLCDKCSWISHDLADQPIQAAAFANKPQCSDCGIAFSTLSGPRCGMCKEKYNQESGLVNQTLSDKQAERSQAFSARIHRPEPRKSALQNVQNKPSVPLTSESVTALQKSSGSLREAHITICLDVRIKGKLSSTFGSSTRAHAESVTMTEIHEDAVKRANEVWLNTHDQSLIRQDTELWWHGNRRPEEGTDVMSLGEFYVVHQQVPNSHAYFSNVPKGYRTLKGKFVCLELWINEESFDMRTEPDPVPKGKGKRRSSNFSGQSETVKRPRASGPAESSFVFSRLPALGPPEIQDTVKLQFANCSLSRQTGEVGITWGEVKIDAVAQLARTVHSQGKTKKVFTLNWDNNAYVAKRFFEVGRGTDNVSVDHNAALLQADIVRLKRGAWFWDRFKELAMEKNREIATDMEFAYPILAQEILEPDGSPSIASNSTASDVTASQCQAVYWLLEERRTPVVNHYSYTLSHPDQQSFKGKTVIAFVHFAWVFSQENLVFADMQGSPGLNMAGRPVEVLFDPMTHSVDGKTGLGDFGRKGIKAFLAQHQCNKICEDLGLKQVSDDFSDMEQSEEEGI